MGRFRNERYLGSHVVHGEGQKENKKRRKSKEEKKETENVSNVDNAKNKGAWYCYKCGDTGHFYKDCKNSSPLICLAHPNLGHRSMLLLAEVHGASHHYCEEDVFKWKWRNANAGNKGY